MINAQRSTGSILIAPVTMTNSATQTANLDTKGSDYATIDVPLSAEANTNAIGPAIVITESDDTVVTNFATFNSDFSRTAEDITAAKLVRFHLDTRARKRFIRIAVTTETTTNDGVTVSAIGSVTRQEQNPDATDEMADVAVIG